MRKQINESKGNWISGMYKTFKDIQKILKNHYNGHICHYTSSSSLLEILKKNKLWFSNIFYLNDSEELLYTYRLLDETTEEQKRLNAFFKDAISSHCYSILKEKNIKDLSSFGKKEYYVASFSKDKDNLNMWNYYTKISNATGYNIVFNKEQLIVDLKNKNLFPIHGLVNYKKDEQKIILKSLLLEFNKKYTSIYENSSYSRVSRNKDNTLFLLNELCNDFFDIIRILGLFFKHEAFINEEEYRIVVLNDCEVKNCAKSLIREKNGLFIPYIECFFSKENLVALNIGPTLKDDFYKTGIERMLYSLNYKKVNISNSKIPLRY